MSVLQEVLSLVHIGRHRKLPTRADRHRCNYIRTRHVIGPVIDFARLIASTPKERSVVVDGIRKACQEKNFFQVINHGISPTVTDNALVTAMRFFESPTEEKMELTSDDITKPVRFSTSFRGDDKKRNSPQRFFLKQYSHPLEEWINQWPSSPPEFREDMGRYAVQIRKVALELISAIMESLGLGSTYLSKETKDGVHVLAVNGYPVNRNRKLRLGFHAHTDYPFITVLLQSYGGLEQFDTKTGTWNLVELVPGALLVQVGNHLELVSNGRYKSAIHRVLTGQRRPMRVSIASLHSLAMEEKVEVAEKLVDETNPRRFRGSSFKGVLEFLSSHKNDQVNEDDGLSYLDTLRIGK